ncbi:hyaluronoglucosaminidase [Actinacidiphila yanglinensis]|uniref:Hyaluronoglucosaminidase n=1 Tax=Actinacidiphila yanglinensis TaxID=310779 RepID=A0A1H6DPP2_9ACTN|nr:beta-N-acetylglucosaminidase domain-containing protein [Actinacidiphila yanglinensis]SEG86616.1 hyaluronoglucosaminidase [Actinacidiphila yanglinensis]
MRRGSAVAVVATVVGGLLGPVPAWADAPASPATGPAGPASASADTGSRQGTAVPAVWPKPQSITAAGEFAPVGGQHVTLVSDPGADPYALDVVEDALTAAGAARIVRAAAPGPGGGEAASPGGTGTNGLTVYVGTDAASAPLARLRAPAAADLPSGGYRLAVGGRTVAMAGVGDDGLFHAAQTLRQLTVTRGGTRGFAGVVVRDWPNAPVRGVAESYYGVPWTQAQRLDQLDFLARTKQNRYLYAPGDDPYRQAQWKEPYPAAQRADFRALARRAAQDHVMLQWAVAPGQAMCFSSPDDQRALEKKLDAMWALGFRAFQLQFQDVSYSEWHCAADTARFGSGPDAAARAQAQLTNTVAAYLWSRHGTTARGGPEVSLLPTEYYQDGATPYRTALAAALDPDVEVAWTGVGVLPQQITGAQVAKAKSALRHPLLTVDNYPVNDFAPKRLFLGPYTGRQPALATVSAGLLTSGMQQPAASRIPLFTAADFAWNPGGYDPRTSWQAGIDDLAGGDQKAEAALTALASDEESSALGGTDGAYLDPLVKAFWTALDGPPGNGAALDAAAAGLRAAFGVLRTAPQTLDGLAGGTFGDEVRPWLDRMAAYGAAGQAAVDMLLAQARGDGAAAWRSRQELDGELAALDQGTVKVAGQTVDAFLDQAVDRADAWTGLRADGRTATTTMASGRGSDPSAMVDGKDGTSWSSAAAPQPDDAVGVDLGGSMPIGAVRITMGDGSGSDDFLHDAVLEVSDGSDPGSGPGSGSGSGSGSGWRKIGTYHDQPVITATLPPGTRARQVRLRATAPQTGAVTVREFDVAGTGQPAPTATGGPHAAAVLDGDLTTGAGPGPLTVDLGGARLLDTVTVVTGPPAAPAAPVEPPPGPPDSGWATVAPDPRPKPKPAQVSVQVRQPGGAWRTIGSVRQGGWAELPAGVLADAVRLSDGNGVREVVPWFAGAPKVAIDRPTADAEAGGPAVTVTAEVSSGLPRDTTLAVVRSSGGKSPVVLSAARSTPLRRGSTTAVPLRLSVPAGTAPGSYAVPVRFTVSGRTVERTLTVRTHPRTTGPDLVPGSTATSSANETPDFPPSYVADGNPSTRWSSPVDAASWVQVRLPAPARVGKVVLHWEDAYAAAYRIQTSTDGVTWHTAATVTDGSGGTEGVWLDSPTPTRYLRMQGVRRATKYGYSLYAIEAYATAD